MPRKKQQQSGAVHSYEQHVDIMEWSCVCPTCRNSGPMEGADSWECECGYVWTIDYQAVGRRAWEKVRRPEELEFSNEGKE